MWFVVCDRVFLVGVFGCCRVCWLFGGCCRVRGLFVCGVVLVCACSCVSGVVVFVGCLLVVFCVVLSCSWVVWWWCCFGVRVFS